MATKTTTMERGRDIAFTPAETASPSMVSSWLTGLMLIIVIALVASFLNSAAMSPRTSDGVNAPVVVPDGSNPGAVQIRNGNEDALDAIADVPASTGASTSSGIAAPRIDTTTRSR